MDSLARRSPSMDRLARLTEVIARQEAEKESLYQEAVLNERRYRLAMELAPIGMLLVVDRVVHTLNRRMAEITGYAPEELVGQSTMILYPTLRDWLAVENFTADGHHHPVRIRRKDGRIIDCSMQVVIVDGPNREWIAAYYLSENCGGQHG